MKGVEAGVRCRREDGVLDASETISGGKELGIEALVEEQAVEGVAAGTVVDDKVKGAVGDQRIHCG